VVTDGSLVINKRAVTLTSATDSKTYDGTPLTNDTVTVGGEGFADGEGATYNVTGSQTEKGDSKNTFEYTLTEGTNAANYDITTVEGTLTVNAEETEIVVTITGHKATYTYDGSEKSVTGYDVEISNALYTENDFTFSGTAKVTGTDADTYAMGLKAENFSNTSDNFTNVTIVVTDGSLVINKRAVTLTSATDSKAYDGTALTNDTVTVSGEGFAANEGAEYDVTGTQTFVGSSENSFTIRLMENTSSENYEILTVFGKLTVEGNDTEAEKATPEVTENYNLGDVIPFTITVKNILAEELKDITVTDENAVIEAMDGVSVSDDGHTAVISVLSSGESIVMNAVHEVTEDDILAGAVENTATVTSKNSEIEVGANTDMLEMVPELTVTKTAVEGQYTERDIVTYTVTIENTGNVTVSSITISDTLADEIAKAAYELLDKTTLIPGDSMEFSYDYTVTYEDAKSGVIDNTVTAEGKDPKDGTVTGEASAKVGTEGIGLVYLAELTVTKISDYDDLTAKLNDVITYTIVVSNTGNVKVQDLTVEDTLADEAAKAAFEAMNVTEIAVGDEITFTYTYTTAEWNIQAGVIENTIVVNGTEPIKQAAVTVEATDDLVTPEEPEVKLDVVKTAENLGDREYYALGEEIIWQIVITNNGNLTLYFDSIADDKSPEAAAEAFNALGIESIAPAEEIVFSYSYTVTAEDILNIAEGDQIGHVTNNITVDCSYQSLIMTMSDEENSNTITASGSVTVPAAQYYTVTFVDYNGTILKGPVTVYYAGSTTAPATPERKDYKFTEWTGGKWQNVTSNNVIYANYRRIWDDIPIDEYNIPLAGGSISNIGECFD